MVFIKSCNLYLRCSKKLESKDYCRNLNKIQDFSGKNESDQKKADHILEMPGLELFCHY